MLCLAGLIAKNRHFVTFYSSCFIFESSIALQNRIQHAQISFLQNKKNENETEQTILQLFFNP